jgi:para-nitrobenzyl esterase
MANLSNHGRCGALLSIVALLLAGCSDGDSGARKAGVGDSADMDSGTHDASAHMPVIGDDPTMVTLADGKLEGDVVGGSVRFLKIPYAKPPVGTLRWKAPVANAPWSDIRHETAFASPCPQPQSQQSPASLDEDCLYLNVWRPNNTTPKTPVLVWIHGGGFTTGSAADLVPTSADHLWYPGQFFAERGILVVTINYRLGVFGFFAHPALAGEGSPVGNQGLLDQRHALRWVHDNIAAFGGDPGNVTIAGESAGAGSVCMHTVSPGSRGLFHRAISESGGCTARTDTNRDTLNAGLERFASEHGCEGAGALDCLRGKPASELVSMQAVDRTMGMDVLRMAFAFGPVVDGSDGKDGFLPEPALDLFNQGKVAKVPYILGTNTEEAQLYFISAPVPASDEEYVAAIVDKYGAFADRVLELYPISKFNGNYRKAMARVATDSGLVCGTLDTARRAVAAGLSVYMYNFNIPWSIARDALGPSHASEISHVFGSPYMETDANVAVATAMNAYWASFVKTGDPNFQGAPASWPRFMPDANDDDQRIQLDPDFATIRSFRKEECKLWRQYAEQ